MNKAKTERVVEELKDIVHRVSGMDKEDMDTEVKLIAYGLDSMLLLTISKHIYNDYQVQIPLEVFFTTLNTLQLVAEHIIENGVITSKNQNKIKKAEAPELVQHIVQTKENMITSLIDSKIDDLDLDSIIKVFECQFDIMKKQNEVLQALIHKL